MRDDPAIVTSVAGEIVGRADELGLIRAFVREERDRPHALVLEGEAGIGKSTLWRTALAEAAAAGCRVLSARPAEAEHGMAFAGLGDLLEPVREEVLPALPLPRRHALQAVMLVEEGDVAVDPRALGVAVRTVFEALAGDGSPLVVAVDDVQWLDRPSEDALVFGLRRVEAPLALLLARRLAAEVASSPLELVLAEGSVERVRVGPLSAGAIQSLVHERLGRVFPRPTLLRIHETSGGNPFYALELAHALPETVDSTRPLPVPVTLEGLVSARVAGLPTETRAALALAAAVGNPTIELLSTAGVGEPALDPAIAAHVLERDGAVLRFTHPLLASVLYQRLDAAERRQIHEALSEVVQDPLDSARHLALATSELDERVARRLESAASLASARGATSLAAELGEHALRLTAEDDLDAHRRRTIALARAHLADGDPARAEAVGDELLARAAPGRARAEALVLLSDVAVWAADIERVVRLRTEALSEAQGDLGLEAAIHTRLAYLGRLVRGLAWGETHARAAVELAERIGDDGLRGGALASLAQIRFNRGEPDASRLAASAYELALVAGDEQQLRAATEAVAHVLTWSVSIAPARTHLESAIRRSSSRSEVEVSMLEWYLALLEHRAGRLPRAAELADAAREKSLRYSRESPGDLLPITLVAASRGDFEAARAGAREACVMAGEGVSIVRAAMAAVLGVVDVWSGDTASAVPRFEEAERGLDVFGFGQPSMRWWRAEYVEALLEVGRGDEAEALLDDWEASARRVEGDWVLAQVARCRGLVEASRGDLDRSATLLLEAAAESERAGDPIGRARALLAFGVLSRRRRQKRAAREAIEEALAIFEECGAARFADEARAELGRIGGRTREEGLTPAEQRVAALVAEGRTNREVAAALVLGERTVETHLTHIYRKLGVRSRTELARVYAPVS